MKKTVLSALILACLASLPVFFGCSPNQSPTGFFTSNTPTPSQGASIVFSRSECGDLLAGNDLSVTVCSVICNQSPSTSRPLTLIENSLGAGFQFQGFGWNGTFPYVDPSVGADPRFTSPNRLSFPNGLAASACVTVLSVFENPDWPANACQTAVADAGVSLSGLPLLSSSVTLQVPCATDTPVFTPTRTPTQTVTITAGPSRTPTPTLTSTFPVTLTGTPTATRTATVSPTASPSTTPSPAFTATASYSPTPTPTGCAKIQLSLSAPTPTSGLSVTLTGDIFRPDMYCGSPVSVTSITFHFTATGNTADQLGSVTLLPTNGFPAQTVSYSSGGASTAVFSGPDLMGLGFYGLVLNFSPSASGTFEVSLQPSEVTGVSDSGFTPLNFPPYPDSGVFTVGGSATPTPSPTPTVTATPTP